MPNDTVTVRLVRADGTIVRKGLRVRVAPGIGDGSVTDEYFWGEITPLDGEAVRDTILESVRNPAVRAFVRLLPVVRTVPRAVFEDQRRH